MASCEIRPAAADELQQLAGIYRRAVGVTCAAWYSAEQIAAWQDAATDATQWAESFRETVCLIAVNRKDGLLAFGDLHPGSGLIGRLYVEPELQGCGIGTALLAAMESVLRGSGNREVALESALNARAFYENRGYACLGMVSLPFNGVLFTQYRMLKRW